MFIVQDEEYTFAIDIVYLPFFSLSIYVCSYQLQRAIIDSNYKTIKLKVILNGTHLDSKKLCLEWKKKKTKIDGNENLAKSLVELLWSLMRIIWITPHAMDPIIHVFLDHKNKRIYLTTFYFYMILSNLF